MRARPMLGLACVYILALLLSVFRVWLAIVAFMVLGAYLLYPYRDTKSKITKGSVVLLFVFLVGLARGHYEEAFRNRALAHLNEGEELVLTGELDKKEPHKTQYLFYLSNCHFQIDGKSIPCNDVVFYRESDEIPNGSFLQITGTVSFFEPAFNEGNFDVKSYYYSQKIDFRLENPTQIRVLSEGDSWKEALYCARKEMLSCAEMCFQTNHVSIMKTMLLGERSSMPDEISSLYQIAGISHILSISGLHITMLGMGVYRLLRRGYISAPLAAIPAIFLVLAYVYMTGGRVSTLRAVIMLFLVLGAIIGGEAYDLLNALSFTVLILLFYNPYYLLNTGFLFSVTAVFGVSQIPQNNTNPFIANVYIQIATLPIIACTYYEIPLYSILANIIIVPVLQYCFLSGLVAVLVACFLPSLACLIALPSSIILIAYEWLCRIIQKLPFCTITTGSMSPIRLILYGILLWGGIYFPKKKKYIVLIGMIFLLIWPKSIPSQITFLDVGQGDAIFLQTEKGISCFLDGGSSDVNQVGKRRILPFLKYQGIDKIDFWFVSHVDADHVSGLLELLESDYPIDTIVLSKTSATEEKGAALLAIAKEKGVSVIYMESGDQLKMNSTSITCLSAGGYADENENSLVLFYQAPYGTAFFGGDISTEVENDLLQRNSLVQADVYKVSHHGSKYSNSMAALERLSPKLAVISCGTNNSYGHPHEETLERLEAVGCLILTTPKSGQIRVRMEKEGVCVEAIFL